MTECLEHLLTDETTEQAAWHRQEIIRHFCLPKVLRQSCRGLSWYHCARKEPVQFLRCPIMLFFLKILPFMLCLIQLFVNVKGLQSF